MRRLPALCRFAKRRSSMPLLALVQIRPQDRRSMRFWGVFDLRDDVNKLVIIAATTVVLYFTLSGMFAGVEDWSVRSGVHQDDDGREAMIHTVAQT